MAPGRSATDVTWVTLLTRCIVAFALCLLAGCASRPLSAPDPNPAIPRRAREPQLHIVAAGENAYRIALRYGLTVAQLVQYNHLDDPTKLTVGQKLWIPALEPEPLTELQRDRDEQPVSLVAPTSTTTRTLEPTPPVGWLWPLVGPIGSRFGVDRRRHLHSGIDILAPPGTAVVAARAGRVIWSGHRGDYGNLIVIDHGDGTSSYYSHNRENLAQEGAQVAQGELIAYSGQTGNATGPHLHFEIRHSDTAVDPLDYLPQ